MAVPNIKLQSGVKLDDSVNHEPGISPSVGMVRPSYPDDDELYEDAGDLDISNGERAVWLVKLPQFLADRWKDIDVDEEIPLGVVKVDRNAPEQKQVYKSFLWPSWVRRRILLMDKSAQVVS
jgi:transcription initiation factor TFIIF subunit beta